MVNEIYSDIKRMAKSARRDISVAVFAVAVGSLLVLILSQVANKNDGGDEYSQELKSAISITTAKPSTLFNRKDIDKESSINVWVFDDTDHHVLLKKNSKYSLFKQSLAGDTLSLESQSGNACNYADPITQGNKIIAIECNSSRYDRVN